MAKSSKSELDRLLALIPRTIRLGSDEYIIEKNAIPEHENSWGKINSHVHVISLDITHPNAKRLAKTMLHEGMHGIWADRQLLPASEEEHIVDQFAAGLIDMFTDNPWLLPWLQKALGQ